MAQAKKDSIQDEFLPYEDLIEKLEKETGKNFTENPTLFQALFDLYKSQVSKIYLVKVLKVFRNAYKYRQHTNL